MIPTAEHTIAKDNEAKPKQKYRVTNWSEYDKALVLRGDITVWLEKGFLLEHWLVKTKTGKRGASLTYSDAAIQLLLMLKAIFRLTNRSVEGFARSVMRSMGLDLPVPDHTQLSRRAAKLDVRIPRQARKEPIHLVADSTGLKVYGEGEWKVRQHGVSKRRTWLKVHLAVDGHAKDVLGVAVTTSNVGDNEVLDSLVSQVEGDIEQINLDGAYDSREAYEIAAKRGAKLVVPPREGAVPWEEEHPRNAAIERIAEVGLKEWKKESGYHRRSIAETSMYRLKQLFGNQLTSRQFETQVNEVHVRVAVMNMMTYLGMPVSMKVAA
jgi:hypothetical protein